MHRDARPCRWWRPYGSPPYSFKSLKFGQFWVSVWGQGPPMRKVLSIWLKYPADENLPQFGPSWPTMTQIKNQRLEKMPQSGSQFYAIFFFSSDWKCRSPTLGRKTKNQGRTQFNCSFNRKRNPSRFHFVWREYDESRRKSMLWVPSSLSRFKKDGVIDVLSHNMDLRVIWTISIFWSVTTGGRFWHQDG